MTATHKLKTIQPYFDAVAEGTKPFEVRFDDRNFHVGDTLILLEYDGQNFTGRFKERVVTYVLRGFAGLHPGWVVLGMKPKTLRRDLLKYLGYGR